MNFYIFLRIIDNITGVVTLINLVCVVAVEVEFLWSFILYSLCGNMQQALNYYFSVVILLNFLLIYCTETAETVGISESSGRVHQRWTEEPEEGVLTCTGRSEANSECPSCYWAIPGSCWPEYWHRRVYHRWGHIPWKCVFESLLSCASLFIIVIVFCCFLAHLFHFIWGFCFLAF